MSIKSGTGQACAACKYQRRRCTPECLLAPFFPADQPKMFLNVHRLFGVKNIQNLLKDLPSSDHNLKSIAINSIKFHATMRDKHPVWGCMVHIRHLSYQIQIAHQELQQVLHQLAYYRQHHHHHPDTKHDYISDLHLGMPPPANNLHGHNINPPNYNINYLDFNDMNNVVNSMCLQHTYTSSNENNPNSIHFLMHPQPLSLHQDNDIIEMQSFFDNIDDTQSYIGSKETYDQSSLSLESSLKDPRLLVEDMDENELKSVVPCFTVTSVN